MIVKDVIDAELEYKGLSISKSCKKKDNLK